MLVKDILWFLKELKNTLIIPKKGDKIQTKEMKKDIERTEYITEAWLQGGKAIGEILKTKNRKKK